MQIVQGLLGSIPQQPVGIPLEGGQVIQQGGILVFLPPLHRLDDCSSAFAGIGDFRCIGEILDSVRCCGKAAVQIHGVEPFRDKGLNLRFPLHHQGQCWGHDPSHIQLGAIDQGEKPGGVDAHQPIGFGAAQGALVQSVEIFAGTKILKFLPDGIVLHGGNPEPLHGLAASGELINRAEDQLPLPSGITGVDDLTHILAVHQAFQKLKLAVLVLADAEAKWGWHDWQILLPPFFVFGVILVGIGQSCQMAKAPGNQIAVAFQVALAFLPYS